MTNKLFIVLAAAITSLVLWPPKVMAHCPLCTAAVGSGLVVARSMGIDDSIVGIWIGAFIISTALWLNKFLSKRFRIIPFQKTIIIVAFFLLTVVPFYFSNLITFEYTLFGFDRLLFGTVAGCILTLLSFGLSSKMRNEKNKVIIPFQTIVVTIAILIISNLALTLTIGMA
ncbi:MAG: hypothetical protein HY512_00885 [Candidatus Aenigmarchaeota archaeon]|nr:hypothetical protein [Candidatus Aenigmarchaeota archaeon]